MTLGEFVRNVVLILGVVVLGWFLVTLYDRWR
jgi:hypothetical protein